MLGYAPKAGGIIVTVECGHKKEQAEGLSRCWARWALLGFGGLNVGLGLIGVIVPGMPTTVFLIVALWAFSKSSERFQLWLWNHEKYGPPLRDWHNHRVIPVRAKILASVMMSASFAFVLFFVAENWMLPVAMAAVMIPAAFYIVTRASEAPELGRVSKAV